MSSLTHQIFLAMFTFQIYSFNAKKMNSLLVGDLSIFQMSSPASLDHGVEHFI